jgi:phosphatidylserine decarboxylase
MLFSMLKLPPLYYIDRATSERRQEEIYGEWGLALMYTHFFGRPLRWIFSEWRWLSKFYGWLMKRPHSAKKVAPFIAQYGVDNSEFEKQTFSSFNDFFVRKLKPEARPVADTAAVCPADGRYRLYPNIREADGFIVKGHKFSLTTLLRDERLARQFEGGAMAIVRLCPTDYHRFHFPVEGVTSEAQLIDGPLASVNPSALQHDIHILARNKRTITRITTEAVGTVLIIEVGATNVGSIVQTYQADTLVKKGQEKGYFEFGGSAIILLFEPNRIAFAPDLIALSSDDLEVLCQMGQKLSAD